MKSANVAQVNDAASLNDYIWGAKAIGIEINQTERQAFHLAKIGAIPVRRIGGKLVASRAELRKAIVGAERAS